MISRTFQLFSGVGPWREKIFWARGVTSWDAFPADGVVMAKKLDGPMREAIARARAALSAGDLAGLAALIPEREHWRLWGAFARRAAFFDIETDGQETMRPTVVSLFAGGALRVFVQGRDLDALPEMLAAWPVWVTFNGACYDVPILQRHFGALPTPAVHLDLRHVCRRLRLFGGLKTVEEKCGFGRPAHLKSLNGLQAVELWRGYRATADLSILRLLVEYNLYDAFQLRSLIDLAYNRSVRALGFDEPALPVFDRGDILYDVSRLLLALGPGPQDAAVVERTRERSYQLGAGPRRPRYLL